MHDIVHRYLVNSYLKRKWQHATNADIKKGRLRCQRLDDQEKQNEIRIIYVHNYVKPFFSTSFWKKKSLHASEKQHQNIMHLNEHKTNPKPQLQVLDRGRV